MNTNSEQDKPMSMIEHLEELRGRLLRFLGVLLLAVLVTYAYRKEILDLVKKPVEEPLKKYTAVQQQAIPKAQTENGFPSLGNYDCSCKPVMESVSPKRKVMKTEGDQSIQEPTQNQDDSFLTRISSIFSDFFLYTQVLLGKNPSPIPGSSVQPVKSQPLASTETMPETIRLNCQCSLSAQALQSQGANMVFIDLPELFFAQMKVAIFAGFFLAFPWFLMEIWGFVGPALYRGEKKVFWVFAISSFFFFIGGALFGYFVVFPFGFDFFLSLTQPGEITPSLSIGEYLGFASKLLMAFGLIFEMPLVVFILARVGILSPGAMIRKARFAILIIFILSAMLTPPDPYTMMLMSGPLLMLYILSIGVCFMAFNKNLAAQRAQGIHIENF